MSKRLANVKTRNQTGFDYVVNSLVLGTPYGRKQIKEKKPYFPGEEPLLREELDKIEAMVTFAKEESKALTTIHELFMDVKDCSFTLERSAQCTLSVVELYEMKSLLLAMEKLQQLLKRTKTPVPKDFFLAEVTQVLDTLDPRGDRINTFYIYEEFSQTLTRLRNEKRGLESELRQIQKSRKQEIKEHHDIQLTPKFDITVSKGDREALAKVQAISQLEQQDTDYMSVVFGLVETQETDRIHKQIHQLVEAIEAEEEQVRERLSRVIWSGEAPITENCNKIGRLDLTLAKALYALDHGCTKPEIVDDHVLWIGGGRQLQAEDILRAKGKTYMPVTVQLTQGVTCITGANMGGKTVSLKMIGLTALLAQYGFFVPCSTAQIGLSHFVQVLIGDSQSLERGLSSFGSEMEELKEMLDHSTARSLILVDEIASGTNPVEGQALTAAIVEYLRKQPFISVITTHFEPESGLPFVSNLQVVGLAHADFDRLNREIKYANRKERIDIIGKHMDYRLYCPECDRTVPKDALNIARMLGISEEIIEKAKEYLNK